MKNMTRRNFLKVGAAVVTASGLAACGGASSSSVAGSSSTATSSEASVDQTAELDDEQVLNYALMSDPKVIDNTTTNAMTDLVISCNITIMLTRLQTDGDALVINPYGATSWESSEDGMTWTFNLADANWEDGVAVTAQQYVDALSRIADPLTGSVQGNLITSIKNVKKIIAGELPVTDIGVTAVDEKTLKVELEEYIPYFLDLTYGPCFTPIRLDVIESLGSTYGTEATNTISCGAFKMQEWAHDSHITLVKNDTYFEADQSMLEQINFRIIKDNNAIMAELYSGTIDRSSVSSQEWRDKIIETGNFTHGDYATSGVYVLIMNTNYVDETTGVKILSNAKIRRAISAAVDRQEACDMINAGRAIPAEGFVPSVISLDNESFREAAGYSPVQSVTSIADPKALFIEGLEELGADPDPSKYTINYLVRSTTATSKDQAEYLYEVFKTKIGFEFAIEQVESAVGRDRTSAGDFGVTSTTYYADYNDPNSILSYYVSDVESSYNTGWKNERYDECCYTATASRDAEERATLFTEAEKIIVEDDALLAPLFHPLSSMVTANYVHGFQGAAASFSPTLFSTVYIDKE